MPDTVRTCDNTQAGLWFAGSTLFPKAPRRPETFSLFLLSYVSLLVLFLPAAYSAHLVFCEISEETLAFQLKNLDSISQKSPWADSGWDSLMDRISTKNKIPSQEIGFKGLKKNCF